MVNLILALLLDKKVHRKTKLGSPTMTIRRFDFASKCFKTVSDKLVTIKFQFSYQSQRFSLVSEC